MNSTPIELLQILEYILIKYFSDVSLYDDEMDLSELYIDDEDIEGMYLIVDYYQGERIITVGELKKCYEMEMIKEKLSEILN